MSMQQSTELIIFVTHVEAEDSYLKIWGQVDKNSATCVERMILPLAEQFARSQGCHGSQCADLHINALCCARFQNEGYYRARIINVRSDGMVVLQFIDYGNIEVLPPQEVHLLENVPGSESLKSFPPVAFDFTLTHVLPVNGIWESKIIESIKKSLWYNEYKILIHTVINNHRFIKLWYNNEDFSELLVKRHMAIAATLQEMFRSKCMQTQVPIYQHPNKHLVSNNCPSISSTQKNTILNPLQCEESNMHRFRQNVPVCCVAQQKHIVQATPIPEALVFKSRVLDVGSKHNVYVSFVEDGPHKFSVQVQSTSRILSLLMRDINTHPIEPLQEPPLPGSVCLGRYTQDKVLCRAVVMSVMENKCKLYYVDFGHTEVLPYTDIFQLPPHYINPKVLSIRFTLSGVKELNVTDEMKEYFKKIVSGKSLVLHVCPPEGPPLVQYGDLYDNGNNIKDILRQAFSMPAVVSPIVSPIVYQQPKQLSKGKKEIVHVSFVESCQKFFVQLDSDIRSLESIMACLAEFCKSAPTLNPTQIRVGLSCAAMYDNQWYRAQVLNINAENVKVLYIDYGNEETVNALSLRVIHEDLVNNLQAQAIKCILNDWDLLPPTAEISTQFELLILEKRLCLKVIEVHSDGIIVDLYDPENMENIKFQLLHANKPASPQPTCKSIEAESTVESNYLKSSQSENTNKWHKKSNLDPWNQSHNGTGNYERSKSKAWKDELNDEKHYEKRHEKSNFYRPEERSERLNRDDFSNNRNIRDKGYSKYDQNETNSFRDGKGARGRKSKVTGSGFKQSHSGGSDKSWSDKDSDTSSRSSSKRGKGNFNRGGYSKRDGGFGKVQGNRWSDKDSDKGSYKGGKTSSDFYHGSNKPKERKGQGYRMQYNKQHIVSSVTAEEARRRGPVQNISESRIPPLSINVGTVKTCELVFTNGPSDFFLQLHPDYIELDSVMESIATIYEDGGELMEITDILNGKYCIAQYTEDSKWYRAIIKSVQENAAVVQFVDYGNTETVGFEKIKTIQDDFLKLPMQAVHCKLFGVANVSSDEVTTFGDKTNGKILEAEFITEDNGIYSILLQEVVESGSTGIYINEEFCKGLDLLKIKETVLNNKKILIDNVKEINQPDYATLDAKWTTILHPPGTKQNVIITWFTNPNNFYCQSLDEENAFRSMMNEIQKVYVGKEPISCTLKVGLPVIAIFPDDGALYRAEIIELNKLNGHVVQYIDFGNSAVVDPQKMYPVEKKLMQLPKLAVQCSLRNIVSNDNQSWSTVNTDAIDNCFNADKYECIFYELENTKYLVSLNIDGNDVADMLVTKHLASFNTNKPDALSDENTTQVIEPHDVQRVDINLLSGQALRVKVSSVESTRRFYIQLPSAAESETVIDMYMADKDPKVMQRLSTREMCLGTGCLVYSNGMWRRAVISNHSRSTGFAVKLIDTGAYDEIRSDCMLALPGKLTIMQNQAIECCLQRAISSTEADLKLKEYLEGKEVIVHIDEVDDSRLIVRLFDLLGNKINIFEDTDEKICPVCPMPILSSTHKVFVSYADHSGSIWLQRICEYDLETNLVQALEQYYPTCGKIVEPKENLLCATKSTDGHWSRAKVIKCTENGAYVNFIDYGNNEEITSDSLMALDPQFYVPHQLAINVSLSVTLNATKSEQLEILQSHLSNKELTAVFHNINNIWTVELLCNGEKISDKFRLLNSALQKRSRDTGEPQIHNMVVGCKYDVYVSHADSPSQFWLQCVDESTNLSKVQETLQAEATMFPVIEGIPEEGSLCVAIYSVNNLWYRAQVLDADEDITTVRFIDYGNTDVIVNKAGNIRQIPDSWKEEKEYAVKCRLDIIPIDAEDWNAATCEKFENLINSADSLQALIIANSVPKRVELFINDKSISDIFVQDKHAIIVHTEEDLIGEIVDLELDPHSAFVSHINSPNEFWVQEEKSVGDLEIMSDRFIVADMFPKVDEIKENLLCVAKFPEDEQWYRARVVSQNNDGVQVIYIDYGNSAISTEIRAIPADLADIPPLSRKCCFNMPSGITEWSDNACTEFTKLAADGATIFLLDVLREDEISLVKLTLNGKDVADILAEFCDRYPPIIEERLPPLGEENSPNAFITRVITPDEFWIHTENNTADLQEMLHRLQAAPSFLPLNTFEVNTICAAQYPEDGQWYRAKILSHSADGTEVFYIDYGNSTLTSEIRMLPEDIINIPALCKRCALQKPDIIDSWSVEACTAFEKLAAEGETLFQFESLDTNDPMLVKLRLDGKLVTDILASTCEHTSNNDFAVKDEVYLHKEMERKSETIQDNADPSKRSNIDEQNVDIICNTKQDINDCITKSEEMSPCVQTKNKCVDQDQNKESTEDIQSEKNFSVECDTLTSNGNMILASDRKNEDKQEANESLCTKFDKPNITDNDQCVSNNTIVELTVDEIIQNMKCNLTEDVEEEVNVEFTVDNPIAESYENKNVEKDEMADGSVPMSETAGNIEIHKNEPEAQEFETGSESCVHKTKAQSTEHEELLNAHSIKPNKVNEIVTKDKLTDVPNNDTISNTNGNPNPIPVEDKPILESLVDNRISNTRTESEAVVNSNKTVLCKTNIQLETCTDSIMMEVMDTEKSLDIKSIEQNTNEIDTNIVVSNVSQERITLNPTDGQIQVSQTDKCIGENNYRKEENDVENLTAVHEMTTCSSKIEVCKGDDVEPHPDRIKMLNSKAQQCTIADPEKVTQLNASALGNVLTTDKEEATFNTSDKESTISMDDKPVPENVNESNDEKDPPHSKDVTKCDT